MKKTIFVLAIVLMIASMAFAAEKTAKAKFTAKDLAGVKGTWEGILGFGISDSATSPVTLEILNDTVPVKAKLTVRSFPKEIAAQLGVQEGANVFENDDGQVTSQGTLVFAGANKSFFEVTFTGKDKANIWYIFKMIKGTANLKKK
jgi:hypothetical protein